MRGGIDFIKDDELQTNSPHSPLAARVAAVMRVINDHAERTGKKVMYAFNVTGELDEMRRGHDVVAGARRYLHHGQRRVGRAGRRDRAAAAQPTADSRPSRRVGDVQPPSAARDGIHRFQKFYRLAGVDHLHVNGLKNKFCEPDESVIASARACLTPMPGIGAVVMPVFSSGQTARQAPDTYQALGTVDLMYWRAAASWRTRRRCSRRAQLAPGVGSGHAGHPTRGVCPDPSESATPWGNSSGDVSRCC